MPYEEDQLARLEQAAVEMDHAEQVRHDRYVAEDAATVLARQREDELHAGGVKLREDRKAALEEAIKRRDAAEVAMSPDAAAELMARVAFLEAQMAKKDEPVVTPPAA